MIGQLDINPTEKKLQKFSMTMAILMPVFIIFVGLIRLDFSTTESLANGFRPALGLATYSFLYFAFGRYIYTTIVYPFYLAWNLLGVILGAIISPIILTAFYYLIITPLGVISRATGKKWLQVDQIQNSFWNPVKPQRTEDVNNQF